MTNFLKSLDVTIKEILKYLLETTSSGLRSQGSVDPADVKLDDKPEVKVSQKIWTQIAGYDDIFEIYLLKEAVHEKTSRVM